MISSSAVKWVIHGQNLVLTDQKWKKLCYHSRGYIFSPSTLDFVRKVVWMISSSGLNMSKKVTAHKKAYMEKTLHNLTNIVTVSVADMNVISL
jgi:hypothetical protein